MPINVTELKFLLVEDSKTFRFAMKQILRDMGARTIKEAVDGASAIEALSREWFDVVLCDYNLGRGKDGQQLLEEARHRRLIDQRTVFFMITGETSRGMVLSALAGEPDAYLAKPITRAILESRLMSLLPDKQLISDIYESRDDRDHLAAIKLCEEKIRHYPDKKLELLKVMGRICLEAGDYERAEKVYQSAIKLGASDWAKLGLGKVMYNRKAYGKAKAIFLELIKEQEAQNFEVHEWLSRALIALGQKEQAQKVLETLTRITPKLVLRQKMLGDVATENEDFDVAERAYTAAVQHGKNSAFKSDEEYIALLNTYVSKGELDKANGFLKEIGKEFGQMDDNPDVKLKLDVAKAFMIYRNQGFDAAQSALRKLSTAYTKNSSDISMAAALTLLKGFFQIDDQQGGKELMVVLVNEYRGSQLFARALNELLAMFGLEGLKTGLPSMEKITSINNEGVKLFKEDKLDEAINYFANAAQHLPGNLTINLNAVKSLISYMKRNEPNAEMLHKVKEHLDRVAKEDPEDRRYRIMLNEYESLVT